MRGTRFTAPMLEGTKMDAGASLADFWLIAEG
jgi:hypothetical protein